MVQQVVCNQPFTLKHAGVACCLLELLCSASTAAAAPSTALLLFAGPISHVLHEEPQVAVTSDDGYTQVGMHLSSCRRQLVVTVAQWAVQEEQDAALHHAFVPVHAHYAVFKVCLVSWPHSPGKLQASRGYLLLISIYVCACVHCMSTGHWKASPQKLSSYWPAISQVSDSTSLQAPHCHSMIFGFSCSHTYHDQVAVQQIVPGPSNGRASFHNRLEESSSRVPMLAGLHVVATMSASLVLVPAVTECRSLHL